MAQVFYRKRFSSYLGEQRAIDDIITLFVPDGPGPSPTPVTPTPTPTLTKTPTPTPSITPTNTPTPSITPTNTSTPTPSVTASPTPSVTATITPSPTQSVTPTLTRTPTITPTSTLTPTPTITPTVTMTPTPSPVASFSPTSISGLTAWWDSQSGVTTSGGYVTSWTDQIGGVVATATSSTQFSPSNPLNSINGIQQLSPYSASMTLTSLPNLTAYTIFVVFTWNYNSSSNNAMYAMGENTTNGIGTGFDSLPNAGPFIFDNDDGIYLGGGGTTLLSTPYYNTYAKDNTIGIIRQNGIQTDINGGWNSGIAINRLFENSGAGFRTMRGTMYNILIYDRKLSPSEITQVETYLSTRYGI